ELDDFFFRDLELPKPKYNLKVGSVSHAKMTARILERLEAVLKREKPDILLVQGDTNTVMAGALCASKLGITVGHVEAGLRSYDASMPEELNRVVADHLSDFLFAPTLKSKQNLLKEGISSKKIFVTGNSIVDAVLANMRLSRKKSKILSGFGLKKGGFILATVHRQKNTDDKKRLKQILSGLVSVSEKFSFPVIFPIHPRTRKMIARYGFSKLLGKLSVVPPLGYFDFLVLLANCRLVLTDSGGIQEEACVLKVPCVTLRDNTERPETIKAGSNVLCGTNKSKIISCARKMLATPRSWKNPFGNGRTSQKILSILRR
ncbi:MAG: non-hydrolyzing UDP-N-acetylglucosamine 2-epimerase, partial [Candidatus Micrarchaeia archaeon]